MQISPHFRLNPAGRTDMVGGPHARLPGTVTRASTSSNLVIVPHAHLALFDNSFAYRGPAIWNALPEHIRKGNNLHMFKKALRAHIMT